MITEINNYHNHLDNCKQCKENPFSQCIIGQDLLKKAASAPNDNPIIKWGMTSHKRRQEDKK